MKKGAFKCPACGDGLFEVLTCSQDWVKVVCRGRVAYKTNKELSKACPWEGIGEGIRCMGREIFKWLVVWWIGIAFLLYAMSVADEGVYGGVTVQGV